MHARPSILTRTVSIATGVLAATAALAILLQDVLMSGAPWTLEHGLMPVIVVLTIATGHLAVSALACRRIVSGLGFTLAFLIGILLTVYVSVGRQAEVADTKGMAATELHADRQLARTRIVQAQEMLDGALKGIAVQCKSGDGPKCDGLKATVKVYQAAIQGYRATLAGFSPERPVAARPERFAQVLALAGVDPDATRRTATLLEPFAFCVLFELVSIVALGFGIGHGRPVRVATAGRVAPPVVTAAPLSTPPKPVTDAELEEVRRILQSRKSAVSNDEYAALAKITKSEASKRIAKAVAAGVVSKGRNGREVAIALH